MTIGSFCSKCGGHKTHQDAEFRRNKRLVRKTETVCGICHQPVDSSEAQVDHIIPLSEGGGHEMSNLRLTHAKCNQGRPKRDRRELYQ